jgi:hypothetical protein
VQGREALAAIKRRADLHHTLRATGITSYVEGGGTGRAITPTLYIPFSETTPYSPYPEIRC